MDVFLIPTAPTQGFEHRFSAPQGATADEYELYYEAPDAEVDEGIEGGGIVNRVRRKFSAMLREAEEWRHRRHEEEQQPAGFIVRGRRKVMGFVVERIAEQRLLWHLRTATEVCAQVPEDLSAETAETIIRGILKADADHHFKWLWIDLILLILSAPLMIIPGPNVPGFYFTFQVIGHYLSMRGAKQGLSNVTWQIRQNPALSELRALLDVSAPQRIRRIHELEARLRLQHFATFFEQVAAPTA